MYQDADQKKQGRVCIIKFQNLPNWGKRTCGFGWLANGKGLLLKATLHLEVKAVDISVPIHTLDPRGLLILLLNDKNLPSEKPSQPEWDKIHANYISDRGLIHRI